MFDLTMLDLSRIQFAVTASFHMVFPAVTVGLSLFLVLVYAGARGTTHHIPLIAAACGGADFMAHRSELITHYPHQRGVQKDP